MRFQQWLPPEAWIIVFRMISDEPDIPPRSDLKNVRLTCKTFEKLATPFLLPRVFCAPLSRPLTTLTAVSRHPVFSRSVNEIVFICNRYHFFKNLLEYKEALRRTQLWTFRKPEELESEQETLDLETAFSQYNQHYDDQTAMEDNGEVIACLCSALMRMPNIAKITISPNFYCYLDSYHYSGYFLEPEPAYNKAFLLMARVLSLTGAKIRKLDIQSDEDICRDPVGVDGAVFRGISNLSMSHFCDAFRGLCEVTITADENDIDGWMTGSLAKILSGATDLERLSFDGSCQAFQISTKYTLSTTAWSRLTSLNFLHASFDQKDLLDLLRRHSGTLKNVDLVCICLTNGSWKILLEGMKSSLSLQGISIFEPSEEIDEEEDIDVYLNRDALENYLLRDGPHPLQASII